MKKAFELGANLFDTAEVYAEGRSEIEMGKALKKMGVAREDVVVTTKLFWGGNTPNRQGLSRKHIIEGTKASLERLGLDYVDVIFAHRPDPETPIEETVRAFNYVIEKGYAFYWGTSEWSAQQLTEAFAIADRLNLIGPTVEQPQYNMVHRERFEKEYAPLYDLPFGLGTTIWSPLASGVLTGKYKSADPTTWPQDSRFQANKGNAVIDSIASRLKTPQGKKMLETVEKLEPLCKELDCTMAQLALAWCLHNPRVSTILTGASKPSQVVENFKSLDVLTKIDSMKDRDVWGEIEKVLDNKPPGELNYRR
jgi:voltage-dependent potassium channel beta subunit